MPLVQKLQGARFKCTASESDRAVTLELDQEGNAKGLDVRGVGIERRPVPPAPSHEQQPINAITPSRHQSTTTLTPSRRPDSSQGRHGRWGTMNDPTLGAHCAVYSCLFIDFGRSSFNAGLDADLTQMKVYASSRPYDTLKFSCQRR